MRIKSEKMNTQHTYTQSGRNKFMTTPAESNYGFWPICFDYETANENIIGFVFSYMVAKCAYLCTNTNTAF